MWHAYATAARTADYQPGALSQYAAGDALMILTRSLYDNHQHGVVLRGGPVLDAIHGERGSGGRVVDGERGVSRDSGCGWLVLDDTLSVSDSGRPSP